MTDKISDAARNTADELEFPDCPVDLSEHGSDFQDDWTRANAHARYLNVEIIQRALTAARQEGAKDMRERCIEVCQKQGSAFAMNAIRALPVEG